VLGHHDSAVGPAASTPAAADLPLRPRAWPNPQLDLVLRIVVLQVLCLIAYGDVYYTLAVSISEGSRDAYLMVVPIHLVIIAFGRGTVAKGVSDGETDWILAIALGGLALLISYLTANRFPTTSGLWNLPLISSMLWGICAATILFGVRRVWQVWPLWLFSLVAVTPLPSMFITASLGGSNFAAASVAAILGAVAVFLGGERSPMRWRLLATAGCAVLGIAASAVLAARPLPVSVSVGAGAVPLICFVLLYRFSAVSSRTTHLGGGLAGDEGSGKSTPEAHSAAGLPLRSPITLTMLVALTGILLVINTAIAGKQKMELARVQADWTSQAGLSASQEFDFIHRYLGTDATFTRYLPAQVAGYPAAAVDVITVASLGALRTLLLCASIAIGFPVTVNAALNERIGNQQLKFVVESLLHPERFPAQEQRYRQGLATDRLLADYFDRQRLPAGSVLMDSFAAWGIWLNSADTKQFIVTSDYDFKAALNRPWDYGVKYLVVTNPASTDADAINIRYPTLWNDGAGFSKHVLTMMNGASDDDRFRIYEITGAPLDALSPPLAGR